MLRRRGAALLRRACNAATDGTADGALRGFSRQIGEQSIPVGVTSTGWMAAARQAVAPLHSLQRGAKAAPAGQQLRRFSGFTDSRCAIRLVNPSFPFHFIAWLAPVYRLFRPQGYLMWVPVPCFTWAQPWGGSRARSGGNGIFDT